MFYYFVTKLHNLSLNKKYSRGKIINGNTRISNGPENFKKYFNNRYFNDAIGTIFYTQLEDSVYIYETGKLEDLKKHLRGEFTYHQYLDFLLRKSQNFVHDLWLIKDNSVYIKEGFLQVYPDKSPEKGNVICNSLSYMPCTSSGKLKNVIFSDQEIEKAISYYNLNNNMNNCENNEKDWQYPSANPLTKNTEKFDRAHHFSLLARNSASFPLKILNYCTVLECLFTSDSTEVNHKIAERFAYFLGANSTERKKYFKLAKDAYGIRSKTTHGQVIKIPNGKLEEISNQLDDAIRKLFVSSYNEQNKFEVFNKTQKEYEEWFTNLILE